MNASRWIIVVLILQMLILLGQWVGQPSLPQARAQIPDAGAQRDQIISQLRTTNDKLDRLIHVMESSEIHVKVTNFPAAKTH